MLDVPPRVVRIRVPSEFQDVKPSGAVVELGVDLSRVPAVGGFRLDALGLSRRVPALGPEEGFGGLGVASGDEMAAAAVGLTVRVHVIQVRLKEVKLMEAPFLLVYSPLHCSFFRTDASRHVKFAAEMVELLCFWYGLKYSLQCWKSMELESIGRNTS